MQQNRLPAGVNPGILSAELSVQIGETHERKAFGTGVQPSETKNYFLRSSRSTIPSLM